VSNALPERPSGLGSAPTSSRRSRSLDRSVSRTNMAAFLGCVAVALAAGSVIFVAGNPLNISPGLRILHTIARASAVGLPIAALFGVPVWVWLSARVPSRALLVALSPLLGILPGLVVLTIGTYASVEGPVFWGLFMMAAGGWSAPFATALYYLVLATRPVVAISLGGVVVVLALIGWLSIWINGA